MVLPVALLRLPSRGLLSSVEGSDVAGARLLPLRKGPLPAQYTTLMAVVGCLQDRTDAAKLPDECARAAETMQQVAASLFRYHGKPERLAVMLKHKYNTYVHTHARN
jgi:hypothetical protein